MNKISTKELLGRIQDENFSIIDVRPIDAYNGWKIQKESRGGHIKGARTLPAKWVNYIDWLDIVKSKQIKPDNDLILYGYSKAEAEKVARQFLKAGYHNISVYHQFLPEWIPDTSLPMESLARHSHLVSAGWLYDLIQTGPAPEYNNNKYIICHAHYRNRKVYEEGHIPGAVDLDTNSLESPGTWNRRPPEEIKKTLENLGITHDTTVILYGKFIFPDNRDPFPGSSAGQLAAFRCAFIMMYAGAKDVRVLNGGLQSWIDEGFDTTTQETEKRSVQDFGEVIPCCPELAVDISEAKKILKAEDKNLVSVRSWREFIGEVSGYHYIEKKGRIPGAVFGNCGSDAYHMENYRNLDHTTREYHEIENMWAEVGITPEKQNSFYCGTGWRASEAFFNAWLMGWPRISVFDGGWFEWSLDDKNPIETGNPTRSLS
ncbi:MAG: rhodanese-like domain-containing protein [Acidobacteriota bacterium]